MSRRAVAVARRYLKVAEAVGVKIVVFEQKLQVNELGRQITINVFDASAAGDEQ